MRITLLSDGVSDQSLLPILVWALRQAGLVQDLEPQWADLRNLRVPPVGLVERIRTALELFPCELLFIHRDAEGEDWERRNVEINEAAARVMRSGIGFLHVCVIPVRMQEAWLLIDEQAIRSAAGNPNGSIELALPRLRDLEQCPDPKRILFDLLRRASELNARRVRKLSVSHARRLVVEHIDDFSPLQELPAFVTLQRELGVLVARQAWTLSGSRPRGSQPSPLG